MRYQLRFFANRNVVDIELFDIQGRVSGADVTFHRHEQTPRPEFVEALFGHRPVMTVFLSGTAPNLSITKRGGRRWKPLLERILETLRDHFDPGGAIMEKDKPILCV